MYGQFAEAIRSASTVTKVIQRVLPVVHSFSKSTNSNPIFTCIAEETPSSCRRSTFTLTSYPPFSVGHSNEQVEIQLGGIYR